MTSVAVVGLGIMGGAIARHLIDAGVEVIGYDPSSEACSDARAAGVQVVSRIDELPGATTTVILSLPSFAAAQQVVSDVALLAAPRTVIETSTLSLQEKLALRDPLHAAGHCILDCPISGTGRQMQEKDVVIYASGDAEALRQAEPMLRLISRQVLNLGAFGKGTSMKLIANHLVAVHNVAAAEAVLLGMKAGFSMDELLAAIAPGAGNSRMFELRGPNVAERCYSPAAMKLSLWSKDMGLIASFVRDLDASTPLFDAAVPLYEAALAAGFGDQDTSAVAEVLRSMSAGNPTQESEED
ncbi:MAG: putative dehydrogenase [Halieaceae bacterium]|jgi:putative dehydrogenase